MHSKKVIGAIAFSAIAAAAMTACGGGGGSAGGIGIKVTASPAALPANHFNMPYTGITTHNPYYSILHVNVMDGNSPMSGATVNCVVSDPNLGGLFQLDDAGPEEEITDENGDVIDTRHTGAEMFQNLNGTTVAGGVSFGFRSFTASGTERINCTVPDKYDTNGKEISAHADIQVGASTGLPALISFVTATTTDDYLRFTDDMRAVRAAPNEALTFQVALFDGTQQRVPNPQAENLLLETIQIRNNPAEQGARLGALPWGSSARVATVNGVAQYGLITGEHDGLLCVRATTDRSDNNVANGIDDPLSTARCWEVSAVAPTQRNTLRLIAPDAYINCTRSGTVMLVTTGGYTTDRSPYTYAVLDAGGLQGVTVDSDGILTVPRQDTCADGEYIVRVQVTDALGSTSEADVFIRVGTRESPIGVRVVDYDSDKKPVFNFTNMGGKTGGGTITLEGYGGKAPYNLAIWRYSFDDSSRANVTLRPDDNGNYFYLDIGTGTCARTESTDEEGNKIVTVTPVGGVTPNWTGRTVGSVVSESRPNDGSHWVYIRATDREGNTGGDWVSFWVSNNCPTCGNLGELSGGGTSWCFLGYDAQ